MSQQKSSSTIAKNTVFLYVRLLFTIFITFFTSRVVLQVLGVEDFGIFNVVGSVVAMFSFLNSGMIQASQRFMSFQMGKGDERSLKDVFSSSLLIHILIGAIVFVGVESIGVWFLNAKMNIAPERMYAANWVLQCSLLGFSISVITVPFYAETIAHEKMGVYAIVGLVDSLLKLGAIYLVKYSSFDNLIFYSILLLVIPTLELIVYSIYCKKHFSEVSFRPRYVKGMFVSILSFAGWSFVGNMGFTGRNAGVNIVINMLCGVAVNAARGIAYQVSSAIVGFASNFQMAIVPQITKRYAANDISSMLKLVTRGSKLSFILLFLMALPLSLRIDYILELWLGNVPEYTAEFVSLVLVVCILDSMVIPLGKAIDATGNIKWFQISVSVVMLLDIPVCYLILMMGVEPYLALIGSMMVSMAGMCVRIIIVKRRFPAFSVFGYLRDVLFKCLLAAAMSYFICRFVNSFIPEGFFGLIAACLVILLITAANFFILALDKEDKAIIKDIVVSKIKRR